MMYKIKFTYTPCKRDGHNAVQVERHVEAEGTSLDELAELGEQINGLIEKILEQIPEKGKVVFASRACRYMMDNINTK